ncbi:hypothetical protein EDC01DRAFT_241529 [Geopyxis carbonaria]|nr:hypothetical protein EDC01DRAFT_241529 [Geopyxis carbonaria]
MRFINILPLISALAAVGVSGHEGHDSSAMPSGTAMGAMESLDPSMAPSMTSSMASMVTHTATHHHHSNATHMDHVGTASAGYPLPSGTNGTNVTTPISPPANNGAGSVLSPMGYGAFAIAIVALVGVAF